MIRIFLVPLLVVIRTAQNTHPLTKNYEAMPEEEIKSLAELVEIAVGRKLKPFIILGSVIIGMFGYVAAPMTQQIIQLNKENTELKSKVDNMFTADQTREHFLTKAQFNFLQKEDQRFTTEAIINPTLVYEIFRASATSRAEQLQITYRSSE